jgi:Na+/melibiose symporter-like transporter
MAPQATPEALHCLRRYMRALSLGPHFIIEDSDKRRKEDVTCVPSFKGRIFIDLCISYMCFHTCSSSFEGGIIIYYARNYHVHASTRSYVPRYVLICLTVPSLCLECIIFGVFTSNKHL